MAILDYKCPNCGGAIEFNPGAQELKCPYCDSVISIEAFREIDEIRQQQGTAKEAEWSYAGSDWQDEERQGMVVYTCQSCSGEIIADETVGATSCVFCGNPVVITSKFAGVLRPDKIVPFKLDKKAALGALQKHYLGKRLLPGVFKDRNHLEEVKGVYVPFWLFNADADVHVEFDATKMRRWSDSQYNYTETSHFLVHRRGDIGFNCVPVDGSQAIDDVLMESIEPFNLGEAVDFQAAYLAGYLANKYDVDATQCSHRAHERMKNSAEAAFRKTVTGYSTVTPRYTNIQLKSGGVQYMLLPVWLLSTSWQGKN